MVCARAATGLGGPGPARPETRNRKECVSARGVRLSAGVGRPHLPIDAPSTYHASAHPKPYLRYRRRPPLNIIYIIFVSYRLYRFNFIALCASRRKRDATSVHTVASHVHMHVRNAHRDDQNGCCGCAVVERGTTRVLAGWRGIPIVHRSMNQELDLEMLSCEPTRRILPFASMNAMGGGLRDGSE